MRCNRTVTTNSKKTLRDNSGIVFQKNGSQHIGILNKIIQTSSGSRDFFFIVHPLAHSNEALCNDEVTKAAIDEHIFKLQPLSR